MPGSPQHIPEIKDLSGYITAIDHIHEFAEASSRTSGLWFRGMSQQHAKALVPSLYRHPTLAFYEREMSRDFRLRYRGFGIPDRSYIERLSMMQHFGLPTRLLDWTENSLCALYFACAERPDDDGEVFVLDPWALNELFDGSVISVPAGDSKVLDQYEFVESIVANPRRKIGAEFPLAFRPVMTNERIQAQRGLFTIHGSNPSPIEALVKKRGAAKVLWRLVISGSRKAEIRHQLAIAGVTWGTLFPSVEGLCREIRDHYTRVADSA